MSSLQAHLERHDLAASPLEFRRDCPLCRAERVQGQLPSPAVLTPRARAAMTAAILAAGAVGPGAAAAADGQGFAAPPPASPPPPQASDVAVDGSGGAAPVDGDHGAQRDPADANDHGSDGGPRASEREQDTEVDLGAVAPNDEERSDPVPVPPSGSGDPDGSQDAAAVQPSPAAQPAGDDAPTGRPAEPDRPPETPGAAAAPAPSQDELGASAQAHSQPETGRGAPSANSPAAPAGGQAVGADHHGGSEEHPARASGRGSSSHSGGTVRGGARHAPDASGSADRARRTTRDGEVLVADAAASRSDRVERRDKRETAEPVTYRVRPGDSLWRIAGRQLGSDATATAIAQEVTRLWELNRQRIGTGNPDLIFAGQTLMM